jgi:hypothetical protein
VRLGGDTEYHLRALVRSHLNNGDSSAPHNRSKCANNDLLQYKEIAGLFADSVSSGRYAKHLEFRSGSLPFVAIRAIARREPKQTDRLILRAL